MKIGGVEPSGPAEEVLVLPRSTGDLVFTARAVLDMSEFHAHCPSPKAPGKLVAGGKWEPDINAPAYREQIERLAALRVAYIVIKSLEGSVEWDTVDMDKPETWLNWEKDLRKNKFSDTEINRVMVVCMQANCLDELKLKAAREAFLLGQVHQQARSFGQKEGQPSTQSGEDAKGSA